MSIDKQEIFEIVSFHTYAETTNNEEIFGISCQDKQNRLIILLLYKKI